MGLFGGMKALARGFSDGEPGAFSGFDGSNGMERLLQGGRAPIRVAQPVGGTPIMAETMEGPQQVGQVPAYAPRPRGLFGGMADKARRFVATNPQTGMSFADRMTATSSVLNGDFGGAAAIREQAGRRAAMEGLGEDDPELARIARLGGPQAALQYLQERREAERAEAERARPRWEVFQTPDGDRYRVNANDPNATPQLLHDFTDPNADLERREREARIASFEAQAGQREAQGEYWGARAAQPYAPPRRGGGGGSGRVAAPPPPAGFTERVR